MIIDFEHHYIPVELGTRLGMDPKRKEAVKTRDANVHSQLFDLDAQIADMDRVGIDVAVEGEREVPLLAWRSPRARPSV